MAGGLEYVASLLPARDDDSVGEAVGSRPAAHEETERQQPGDAGSGHVCEMTSATWFRT